MTLNQETEQKSQTKPWQHLQDQQEDAHEYASSQQVAQSRVQVHCGRVQLVEQQGGSRPHQCL